ncbi:MAG: hypothetical protein AAF754_16285, partial [Pseudomonadota bacterium]
MYANEMGHFVKSLCMMLVLGLFWVSPAFAHAADQGFVLLLPTTAYIAAGTMVVVLTILLLVLLKPGQLDGIMCPVTWRFGVKLNLNTYQTATQLGVALSLALLLLIGLRGPTDPQANLMPLVLWTVWWMFLFVVQALIFDVWSWINPWPALHRFFVPANAKVMDLPASVSVWPAVLVMALFQGFVLADAEPNDPGRLSLFALGYWLFTWAGMTVFGRGPWLQQAECFTVLFRLIGAMRPAQGRQFGLPGWQVFAADYDLSHAAFVLIILAAGSFDGLYETFWWLAQIGVNPLEYPGRTALIWSTTVG